MKKLAIAGASLAFAAMPVVGVFAATEGSFTDNITVTIEGGLTFMMSLRCKNFIKLLTFGG